MFYFMIPAFSLNFQSQALTESELTAIKDWLTSPVALQIYVSAGTMIASNVVLNYLKPVLQDTRPKTDSEKRHEEQENFVIALGRVQSFQAMYQEKIYPYLNENINALQNEKAGLEKLETLDDHEKKKRIQELETEISSLRSQRAELKGMSTQLVNRLKNQIEQAH